MTRAQLMFRNNEPTDIALVSEEYDSSETYICHHFASIAQAELIAREILILVKQADLYHERNPD